MVIWCDFHLDRQHRLATLRGNWWMQLVLMLMLVCFAYVLYLSTATNRDGFWVSFLLCVGILLSLFPPETLAGWNHDDIGYAFVTLCHCNVHPASLCLVVVVSTVSKLFCRSPLPRPGTYGTYLVVLCNMTSWPLMGHRFHTCLTECLLLAAFTMDFSNRIQAVATGILYGCESDSTASALLQSPVAGRSGRQPCWLAGFFSWIWWLIDISFDRFIETDAEQLQVALSFCLLFLLVCGLSAYSWRKFHALGADIVLGILCHTPAALKSVELIMGQANPSPGSSFFSYPVVLKYQLMHVLATQTLVQAGCHPGVCAAFTLPLCVFALWEQALSAGDLSKMDTIHVQLLTGPLVCLVLICNHFIDYFSRMKAIQEGFASSTENARTREHLAAPGVEQLGSVDR